MDRTALLEQGPNKTGYRLSTARSTFELIRGGERPWVALGTFLDDWKRATPSQRHLMTAEPISVTAGGRDLRWAALLAAIVEWLCYLENPRIDAPAWTADPRLTLTEPWFLVTGTSMRGWQIAHSPAPFRARNIFTDESVIARA